MKNKLKLKIEKTIYSQNYNNNKIKKPATSILTKICNKKNVRKYKKCNITV